MTDKTILNNLKEVFKEALLEIFESHPDLFKIKGETIVVKKRPLNSKEAADWLSISQKTLYALHEAGVINASRVGKRKLLFSMDDLDLFLKISKGVCISHEAQ